jgi:hypothetical protein
MLVISMFVFILHFKEAHTEELATSKVATMQAFRSKPKTQE